MNSLEALEKLDKHFNLSCYSFDPNENSNIREYNIIKKDLERLEKLEEVLIILNIIYEWKLEVNEFDDGTLGYFIYSPNWDGYYNITEEQYDNFKEVLENE